MTIGLLLLAVLLFFISEIFGDLFPIIQDRFRVAGCFVIAIAIVWIIALVSVGDPVIPDAMSYNKIVIEKCRSPC